MAFHLNLVEQHSVSVVKEYKLFNSSKTHRFLDKALQIYYRFNQIQDTDLLLGF